MVFDGVARNAQVPVPALVMRSQDWGEQIRRRRWASQTPGGHAMEGLSLRHSLDCSISNTEARFA